MEKKWRRIGKGETIPTSSIIRQIDGGLPNITGSCVMMGQDCYYISVDDAYELLKGLPLETDAEAKERNEAIIIKKLIGLVKETDFLSEENRASLLDWLEKQGEQKPVEDVNGDDYGIDSLWHAQRILEKTLGKVDGYQTDDGILEHKCAISAVKELYGQNPYWSEKDEEMFNYTISLLNYNLGSRKFIKSLKFKLLSPLMREFEKEEGSIIDHLIAICDDAMCYDTFAGCSKKDIEKYKTFLTNLKFGINPQPQTTWKPSDEQMAELRRVISGCSYDIEPLVEMEEQLKKLREE